MQCVSLCSVSIRDGVAGERVLLRETGRSHIGGQKRTVSDRPAAGRPGNAVRSEIAREDGRAAAAGVGVDRDRGGRVAAAAGREGGKRNRRNAAGRQKRRKPYG